MDETDAAAGQISAEAARIYEDFFVPALFGQFAPWLVEAAGIRDGDRVLDVATGTGVVARAAQARAARVSAVDINPGMLAMARKLAPELDIRQARAEALPFADDSFDAVTCQFALMFLADRRQALREMARVCRPGGWITVSVFAPWPRSPGYNDLIPLLEELMGAGAAEALKVPFCLGEDGALAQLLAEAGLEGAHLGHRTGEIRHPSLDAWLETEIGGWTLAEAMTPARMTALKRAAPERLGKYRHGDGSVSFECPALFAVTRA
ncbi:methyltransferase domain-containing protein [Pseudooceanicola sp. CBS1P-1]|uniref:Methyltransferase domain-containing protein n=1 Tax=Pseudooceanicola albus TaxID=2692189 RepID=A0A6L7FY97_9RHOB|nr:MULTISPECIES: methyltransferase domain-containing protein [Pseudooceanicola]MBT9382238.1 methyltransferase domain-containing protein [Pseudooceanicola endophyticus]MXN16781.1 methyltransferase domain-containing protein [Pseudooceanicola albus]